jgi:hypothetical protein
MDNAPSILVYLPCLLSVLIILSPRHCSRIDGDAQSQSSSSLAAPPRMAFLALDQECFVDYR